MAYDVYEITVEVENGDWHYTQVNAAEFDFHRAVITGLDFAYQRRGKLVSVNKIGVARTDWPNLREPLPPSRREP